MGYVVRVTHSFTGGFIFMIAALVCAAFSFLALFPYLSGRKRVDWASGAV
jgi:hypothetical protein